MGNLPIVPPSASNFAPQFNALFCTLLALTVVFGGGVIFMTAWFAIRYRAGSTVHRKRPEHENLKLESVLIGVPLILGVSIFAWGIKLYSNERTMPDNAIEILVIGKQWMWQIQHSNGAREMDRLTIPVGRPVKLIMVSQDVIHEFYVPAFRVQFQVIPGRYTAEWFIPTKVGTYDFMCAQYCGTDHSRMTGKVNVLSDLDYATWMTDHAEPGSPTRKPLVEAGKDLFQSRGCVHCHGPVDTPLGPSLVGIYRTNVSLESGSQVADEDYLRRAIKDPKVEIVTGYDSSMPPYSELSEQDTWAIVSYLQKLANPSQLPPDVPRAPALEKSVKENR